MRIPILNAMAGMAAERWRGSYLPMCAVAALALPATSLHAGVYTGFIDKGCYRTAWQSKMSLYTALNCEPGFAIRSIAFSHRMDENETHQESFQLQCCKPTLNMVTDSCQTMDWQSNWNPTEVFASGNSAYNSSAVFTGIEFWHAYGYNGTHQQWFRMHTCALAHERSLRGTCTNEDSKWDLISEIGCGLCFVSSEVRYFGEMSSIGFWHLRHENGTHQEHLRVGCGFH